MKTTIITEEKLIEILPHGSGIDCDWEITEHENGNVTAKNFYHAMNENGYYDGYMPFKVKIFRHKKDVLNKLSGPCEGKTQVIARKGDVDWSLSCNENRKRSFYGLKEYLEQTIDYCLSENKVTTNRNEII